MTRTVSATAAKSNFGALVESIGKTDEIVVVENRGEPVVAIISIDAWRELVAWREEERRRTVLAKLRAIQARTRAKNPDLSEQDVADLANRVRDDAMKAVIERDIVQAER